MYYYQNSCCKPEPGTCTQKLTYVSKHNVKELCVKRFVPITRITPMPQNYKFHSRCCYHVFIFLAVGFDHGEVAVKVKTEAGESIWDNSQQYTCDELAQYSPIKLTCPVKKDRE